jgi:hypothetical protein
MTDPEEPSPDKRWLDQFLGDMAVPACRDEMLNALRNHVLGEVICEVEVPGREMPLLHAQGVLVEASREPGPDYTEWENATRFAVVTHEDANVWHNRDDFLKAAGRKPPGTPMIWFDVPHADTGIRSYPGVDAGASGFRIPLGGGADLAVMLWHGVMHVTKTGDVVPGLGGFTGEIEPDAE